jgi:hypothetical protein
MSTFLLLGVRPFPYPEVAPVRLGTDLARAAVFIGSMRRWRLLDGFASGPAMADQPRAVLLARASSLLGAAALGRQWSGVSGLEVSVWPLRTSTRERVHGY